MPADWRTAPFVPAQLPRLTEALDGLAKVLADGDASPKSLFGAASGLRWLPRLGSVDQLLRDGWLSPAALDKALQALPPDAADMDAAELLDLWLLPTLLEAIAGLAPLSPQLDPLWRAVQAAGFAVDAWRPLLDPTALEEPPAVGAPDALGLLPAYRAAQGHEGLAPLVAYAIGKGGIPPFVARWRSDAASAIQQPALGEDAFAEHEAAWLEDLLLGLHARSRKQSGWPVLVPAPPQGGVVWDTTAATLAPAGKSETLLQAAAQGWLRPLPATLPAPPMASRRLHAAGWQRLHIAVHDPEALDDVLDGLFELCEDPAPPFLMEGEGFAVAPM